MQSGLGYLVYMKTFQTLNFTPARNAINKSNHCLQSLLHSFFLILFFFLGAHGRKKTHVPGVQEESRIQPRATLSPAGEGQLCWVSLSKLPALSYHHHDFSTSHTISHSPVAHLSQNSNIFFMKQDLVPLLADRNFKIVPLIVQRFSSEADLKHPPAAPRESCPGLCPLGVTLVRGQREKGM